MGRGGAQEALGGRRKSQWDDGRRLLMLHGSLIVQNLLTLPIPIRAAKRATAPSPPLADTQAALLHLMGFIAACLDMLQRLKDRGLAENCQERNRKGLSGGDPSGGRGVSGGPTGEKRCLPGSRANRGACSSSRSSGHSVGEDGPREPLAAQHWPKAAW